MSEDRDARRVTRTVPAMQAFSVYSLLHRRVHAGRMSAQAAGALADKLHKGRPWPQVTATEFADPTRRGLGSIA